MGNDSIKSSAQCSGHDTVARLQGYKAVGKQSRGWSGGSTKDRGPEDGCVGQLCREARDSCADRGAQGMAVRTEGSIGQLCRQRGPEAETTLLHADSL